MLCTHTHTAPQALLRPQRIARVLPANRFAVRHSAAVQQQQQQGSRQVAVRATAADDLLDDIDWTEDMPVPVKRRVAALRELQTEADTLRDAYIKERADLDAKWEQKWAPLFDKRRAVVAGQEAVGKFDIPDSDEPDTGIPDFWLMAMTNHDIVGEFITERDSEVLAALRDIRCTTLTGEDAGSFRLTFVFDDNDFFKNKVLEKTFFMSDPIECIPSKFVGTTIDWLPGKDVTVETVRKMVKGPGGKGKGKGGKVAVTSTEPCDSFFNFFKTPEMPEDPNDLDDEALEELQDKMDQEFEVATTFKDYIVPRSVEWFTGEAAPPMLGDDYEGEGDYGEFGEDFDDEDLEEEPVPRGKKK